MRIAACFLMDKRSFYCVFDDGSEIKIGSKSGDTIEIQDLDCEIEVSVSKDVVTVKKTVNRKSEHFLGKLNSSIIIDETKKIAIYLSEAGEASEKFNLPENCEFSVGKSERKSTDGMFNTIILRIPYVGRYHFKIERHDGETWVKDYVSRNGLYLNGERIHEAKLTPGDILSILTVRFLYDGESFQFENVGNALIIRPLQLDTIAQEAPLIPEAKKHVFVKRAPRIRTEGKTRIIDLEKPPQAGDVRPINWLSVFLPPVIMIALLLVLVFALGMSPVMLIMSGVMSVLSAVLAIVNYRKQKKENTQKAAKIDDVYTAYLRRVEAELDDARLIQLTAMKEDNPSPHECERIVKEHSEKLWNRLPTDHDFVCARVGIGNVDANVSARFQRSQVVLEENELEQSAISLAARSQFIPNAPIVCDLHQYHVTGVSGQDKFVAALVNNMILELAVSHSYHDLRIVIVFDRNEKNWSWARWLPHCCDDQREHRYLLLSSKEAETALKPIEDDLERRAVGSGDAHANQDEASPYYLFVVSDASWFERTGLYKKLLTSSIPGTSILCLKNGLSQLPKECEQIIEIDNNQGTVYKKTNSAEKTAFTVDSFSLEKAERAARMMAPLLTESDYGNADLPTAITFLEGYRVNTPEELNIEERWSRAKTYKTLAVPVAALPAGGVFRFDIHEEQHGVMGIVAGMPGAGKTEMVQSWLLSLAVNYSPQDVSFVLIDFKGTGLIAPFARFPHLAGAISNLDASIDRKLKALKNEVERRQKVVNGLNINDYNKAVATRGGKNKLPILIVAIDEYAEFKKKFPEFGQEVDTLTSEGRSLGIFVVLMTQKPAGVVSEKSKDNINFRWCLRVANYGASREMLGTLDAARLSNPGRVIVKIGAEDFYQEMQSFWCGAQYDPERINAQNDAGVISLVSLSGERRPAEAKEASRRALSGKTEIEVVGQYIFELCKKNNIKPADKIWTDGLPERISLEDVLPEYFADNTWPEAVSGITVGMVDDPSNQKQYALTVDYAEKGHTVMYGLPSTGKTTFLKTVLLSVALTKKPDSVSIYVVDIGGWNFAGMQGLPHIGGVVSEYDLDRLFKLQLLLKETLEDRKYLCRSVGNISAYRMTGKTIPDVLVIVDNFDKLIKAYPDALPVFSELLTSGANFGIYMIVTSNGNGISSRISQSFRNVLSLQLTNRSDYSMADVGKIEGDIPTVPGRGYQKGNPPLEFQVALPLNGVDDLRIVEQIQLLANGMRESWTGNMPEPIPEMPDVIPYGSVKCNGVPLGLSVDRVRPVAYNDSTQHYLLISGTDGSGKSNLLTAVSRALVEKKGGKLYSFDVLRKASQFMQRIAASYLSSSEEIDRFVEKLIPELQYRFEQKRADQSISFEPIVFAVDDYSHFFKMVSNATMERLKSIVLIGAGLDLYLIVAGDAYEMAALKNKGEAVLSSLARGAQSIVLGGTMADHAMITVKASHSQTKEEVGEFEGFLIQRQIPTRFKAISCEGD